MTELKLSRLLSQYVDSEGREDMSSLRTLMEAVIPDRRYEVICSLSGRVERNAAHIAAKKAHTHVLSCLMEQLTEEERYKLMMSLDMNGQTTIHLATIGPIHSHLETLKYLLESATAETRFQMLKVQDGWGSTAFHWAAWGGRTETIMYLLDLLPPNKPTAELLDLQNFPKLTALGVAMERNHTATIECLRLYQSKGETRLKQAQEGQKRDINDNIGDENTASWSCLEEDASNLTTKLETSPEEDSELAALAKNDEGFKKATSELTDPLEKLRSNKGAPRADTTEAARIKEFEEAMAEMKNQNAKLTELLTLKDQQINELRETVERLTTEPKELKNEVDTQGIMISKNKTEIEEIRKEVDDLKDLTFKPSTSVMSPTDCTVVIKQEGQPPVEETNYLCD